ncbi:MAG: type II toxin-antitoxin system VapC family toxin [Nitrospirae bacterium]|nr:type II toxin-antitoxin system VapC family toxin [Nitrospirota bacterium]
MKVLDASVIVKWYKDERESDKALGIRDGFVNGNYDLAEPDLILYELANTIRFSEGSEENDIKDVLENFSAMGLEIIVPTITLLKNAAATSYKFQISIYDAVYVALAKSLDAEFVTADKRLYQKVKGTKGIIIKEL